MMGDQALCSVCRRNLAIGLNRLLARVISWCIALGHYTIGNSMVSVVLYLAKKKTSGQLHSPSKILGVRFLRWKFWLQSLVSAFGSVH